MNHQPRGHGRHRLGRWLPNQDALEDWLEGLVLEVRDKAEKVTLHPVIEEFRELIDADPVVRMYVTQLIEQVPHAKRYSKRHLENVDQMLFLMDEVIGRAPEYNETGLVGVPLNAVLDWCMGTPAGFAAFRHPPINAMIRKILNVWCEFLSSPASLYVLNDSPRGWKCAPPGKRPGSNSSNHRWHSPVTGTIHKAFVREGTYYSEAESEGEDPEGPNRSQGYIAHVATRAIILIESDDPVIGLVCLMPVGMGEVSSCVIHPEVRPGRRVKECEELGFFQYGGSTYCLIFRPGAIADFAVDAVPQPDNPAPPLVLLGTRIATAG